ILVHSASVMGTRPKATLFPYTTLFRSAEVEERIELVELERDVRGRGVIVEPREVANPQQRGALLLAAVLRGGPGHLVDLEEVVRSEEHTSELQSRENLVCRLLLEKKKN